MAGKSFTVDLNKPLVFQVGHLGANYQKWVYQPVITNQSSRFFENKFVESLTRTTWWIVPIIWIPVFIFAIFKAIQRGSCIPEIAYATCTGLLLSTLTEYVVHRFIFHINTTGYWANTLHYVTHGCHHKHPMDRYRIVFPPAATTILCVPFLNMVKLCAPNSCAPAVFGGILLGYVLYDLLHYYLHHGYASRIAIRSLKKYHANHHFKHETTTFGVTTGFWDWVFGTLPPRKL